MTVENLNESLQKCPKDSKVYLEIVPLKEEAGIVGVGNFEVFDSETSQMEPTVFIEVMNLTALAHAKFDVKTINVRMVLRYLNNWNSYNLNSAGIPESRLIKFNEIMSHRRQDPQSFNVERELASWLANFDDQNLVRFIEFIAQKG